MDNHLMLIPSTCSKASSEEVRTVTLKMGGIINNYIYLGPRGQQVRKGPTSISDIEVSLADV